MHLSDLTSFLVTLGISPKKRLSQNFLIDSNITRKIIQTANIEPQDVVLEIGPGPGALTKELLAQGATVFAIEKDATLARSLLRLQTPDKRLHVYSEDALLFSWDTIPYKKVVANLPYHITTPLLEKCFSLPFTSITCMIQKEVADRLKAKPHTKQFGSLTLFTQFHAKLTANFPVSSHCFYPKPSVDSTVIHLESHETPYETSSHFFPLLRCAFQQRRKCLSSSLRSLAPQEAIRSALQKSSLREDARPEMLSLAEWLLFIKNLHPCIVRGRCTY